jgi:hypothetical protein
VKKEIDCQVFEDQLDALVGGILPEEGMGQLQAHALSCPDCAMLLRVQEHLALPSLEELEASVPDDLLASLWPRVQTEVGARRMIVSPDVSAETSSTRRLPWLVPTLAAASVALLFSTGFLFSELRQTKERGIRLAEQIEELERGMVDLDARTDRVERTASLAGRKTWMRSFSMDLSTRESVSIAWVQEMVRRLPPDTPLLTASQVEALLGGGLSWGPSALRAEVSEKAGSDGLTALELLAVIDSLGLDPELSVSTSRLRELLT